MDAVPACFCTRVQNRIADARRFAKEYLVFFYNAQSKGVDKRVEAVRFVKDDLTADRRYAKAVAVVADAFDTAFENRAVASVGFPLVFLKC